ncbi:MAG: hypothetical protein RJB34_1712 [Pseudomonadota bacterium]
MSPERPLRMAQRCGDTLQWQFKRNCSVTPRQLALVYALLCLISLTVAVFFWFMGATLVMPFTALELVAVAVAFVVYARHATDRERIELSAHRLVIEQERAGRVSQVSFNRAWVRVAPRSKPDALIEVSEGAQRVHCGHHIRLDLRDQVAQEIRLAIKGY